MWEQFSDSKLEINVSALVFLFHVPKFVAL